MVTKVSKQISVVLYTIAVCIKKRLLLLIFCCDFDLCIILQILYCVTICSSALHSCSLLMS